MRHSVFCLLVATVLLTACATAPHTSDVSLQTTVESFLAAYAAGDRGKVFALLAEKESYVYGSDEAEFVVGREAAERLFDNDTRLWQGSAEFGTLRNVSTLQSRELATMFFDVPFSVGGRPPVTVRFAMVWRRGANGWRLVQSSNVVPTKGQSAEDLLRR
jgi:ketosteroid isomerase-like protein